MSEDLIEVVKFPEGMTEKDKKWLLNFLRRNAEEKMSVYVLYEYNCNCDSYATVLLDRFPMSEKIMTQCPECKKGNLASLIEPVEFYLPWDKSIVELKNLKDFHMDSSHRQFPYLEAYKNLQGQDSNLRPMH